MLWSVFFSAEKGGTFNLGNNSFILMLQAMLDKAKSIVNIKSDIKSMEPKLKIKIQGTLDKTDRKSVV